MNHNITELRDHLFATLQSLRDPQNPMDIERARAVADVAKVVIDSARIEVDYIRVIGSDAPSTGFIGSLAAPAGAQQQLADGGLPRAIEFVLDGMPGELTYEGLHARLVEALGKPLPDLPAALDRLKAEGRIRENKAGTRLSYRWIAQVTN